MTESVSVGGDSEANVTRFLLAVEKGKHKCYGESFDLLYRALGCGRSYATLQEFLVEALDWKKEHLDTLEHQAHLELVAGASGSYDGEYMGHPPDTFSRQSSEQSFCVFSEPPSPVGGIADEGFHSSFENTSVSTVVDGKPLMQLTKETLQKSHSVPKDTKRMKVGSTSSDGAVLENLQSSGVEHTESLVELEHPDKTSQVMKETRQSSNMSSQQPRKKSQSVQEVPHKNFQSKLQPPRTLPQHLKKEKGQIPQSKLNQTTSALQSRKETKSKSQIRPNPYRNLSLSIKETDKRPQSKVQTPRKTTQSMKETSKIPQIISSPLKSMSEAIRKDDQRYQVKPNPRNISRSSHEQINQQDLMKASKAGTIINVSGHSERCATGNMSAVKKNTENHIKLDKQESKDMTVSKERPSQVASPRQPLKDISKKPQDRRGTATSASMSHKDTNRVAYHRKTNLTRNLSQPVKKVEQQNQPRSDTKKSNQKNRVKTNIQAISNVTVHSPKPIIRAGLEVKKVSENSVLSAKQDVSKSSLSKHKTNDGSFSEQETNYKSSTNENSPVAPVSQKASHETQSDQETSHVSLATQENSHASLPKEETSLVSIPTHETINFSLLSKEINNVSVPSEEISQVSLPSQETGNVLQPPQESSHVSPPPQETTYVSLSKQENNLTSFSRQETLSLTSEASTVTLCKLETNLTSSLKQETNQGTPTDQEVIYIASSTHETRPASPPPENEVCITSIVDEANRVLKQPVQSRFSLLSVEPVANQLPREALALLLTAVFTQLPPKAQELIQQLEHFSSVVCYRDMEFSDEQLSLRLRDFSHLIAELVSVVVGCCTEVTAKCIKETSDKLRTSKKRLRSAQKDYEDHVSWVIQTRQELRAAERDLQEAKMKNVRVLRVYSRSQSQESKESDNNIQAQVHGTMKHSSLPKTNDNCFHSIDSESSVFVNELDGQDGASDDNDSLLTSVMKEVAVIEKKHSSASEHDRNLKKMLRNTQESVIETKKEVRNRLHSNVSAEEYAISKEDNLSEKQAVTKKLSRELKKLQKDYKALKVNECAIISMITEDVEMVRMMEVDEKALNIGRLSVQTLREEKSGRLLMESRREAVAFASLFKIPDLGEWLMLKQDVTRHIEHVYSYLRVDESKRTVSILDVVGTSDTIPSVVVLCGPAGSGKSCMFHYLLHHWKSNKHLVNSKLHQLDLVLYCTMSNIMAAGSWSQYLREHVFCTTLTDFPTMDIHEALATMSVLFLIDVGTITPASSEVLKEVFAHLGKNRVLVTARVESEPNIVELVKSTKLSCLTAKLCPMTPDAVIDYSSHLISFFEQENSSVRERVGHFTKLLNSMNASDSLLYPLPLAYLMYLWRVDPGHALRATCLSRLFREVVVVCEHKLTEVTRANLGGDRGAARLRAEQHTQQLYEAAWKQVTHKDWPHHNHAFLLPEHQLLKEQTVFSNFDPLLVIREGVDGKRRGDLPHQSLAEVLCGFHLAHQRLFPKSSPLFRRREKLERYCVPDVKRFKSILPHTAGALVYSKHNVEDAREIVSLYSKSLSDERDMTSWLMLLHECDFLPTMCTAVSEVLTRYSCWTTAQHSQQNNCAVADMLKRGAYQPQQIVISQALQEGISCIIHALSTCSSTLVRLRQDAQFYCWGEAETCDSLVVPLQPPGTLHECWGHLGVEGALALRHSHHLEELNVRISSWEALSALAHSMDHIRRSLRYLYLRLDVQPTTPLSSLQPLNFKGKQLWLRVRGITDASLNWLKNLMKILSSWYTEVVLEESHLSPAELQALKESMPQTPIHISG